MLIDDFTTSKKRGDKLVVTPPPQQNLQVGAGQVDGDILPQPAGQDTGSTVEPIATGTPGQPETPADSANTLPVVDTPVEAAAATADASTGGGFFGKLKGTVSKKQLAIIGSAAAVALVGGSIVVLKTINKKPAPVVASVQPTPEPTPTPIPTPITEPSRLSGVAIAPELNKRHITGIMIENSPDARPQSGLLEAGVVFEAIAEGGITRFLALYQEHMPGYIGPVRSLRPYYLDWLMPFDATIAHVGGSLDALQQVRDLKLKDLDQFQNGGSYYRTSDRYAPHNVYTSMDRLDALAVAKGYTASTFASWPRKADSPNPAPQYSYVDFAISSALYNVHYDYDKATNTYFRSQGGKPHVDEKSNVQITPKTVIALVMPYSVVNASDGSRSSYGTVGTGPLYIFQDGVVAKGTWSKPDRATRFSFLGPDGGEFTLNPGQTWVTMVEAEADISYK